MKLLERLPLLPLAAAITSLTSWSATASAQDTQPSPSPADATTQTQPAPPPPAAPPATSAPAGPAPGAEEEKLPPGSFKIPGTKTTLTLSGYAQLDVTYDFRGRDPHVEDNDWAVHAALTPLNDSYESKEKQNQLYLTARTSRIGFSTKTETDFADIGVKIEGDFNSGNLLSGQTFTNSVLFRLRHAYGTLSGKYGTFLAGQSWSTFLDMPSYPDVVDFNGPGDLTLIRQPQVRYTIPIGSTVTASIAAENNVGTDLNGVTNGTKGPNDTTRRQQTIPDVIAAIGVSGDWGSASIAGLTTQYKAAKPITGPGDGYTNQGWGARASAAFKLPWGDALRGQVIGGNGIGRYLFSAGLTGQGASDTGTSFILWQALAYHVNYTRVWSPMFRSNIVWSQTFFANNHTVSYTGENANNESLNERIDELFANTFFTANKQVEFGLEYVYGNRRTFGLNDEQKQGTGHRIGASAHFNFF